MKLLNKSFMVILFVSLILGQTIWAQNTTTTFTLTAQGVGPVQLGVDPNDLPESVPGLYASKSYNDPLANYLSDDEDNDWGIFEGWQFFDAEGNELFNATVDSIGQICEITISTPKILTPEGIHVGTPQQQLDKIKGAQRIDPDPLADEIYARLSYELNGITYWIDGFYIDDEHSEERVASITIPAEDNTSDLLYEMVNNVIFNIYPFYSSSNSLQQMESHLDEIRNIGGIKNAYSNGSTTLFVELEGGGSLGFSYFPESVDVSSETIENFMNGATGIARDGITKEPLDKFTIAFQMGNDRRFDDEKKLLDKAEKMFQDCGFKGKIQEASIDFFLNDMYNYDNVFIITHGHYNNTTGIHWVWTNTLASILTENEIKNIINRDKTITTNNNVEALTKYENQLKEILLPNVFKQYKSYFINDYISYNFIKEKHGQSMVPICYITVSENLIKYSNNRFNHQGNAIVFNVACESLKGNNGLADAFIDTGAGAYLGYDAINNAGLFSSREFFGRLFSGMTINKAYETIDKCLKSNRITEKKKTWTANLKLISPFIGEHNLMYPKKTDHQFNFHAIDPNKNNTPDNQALRISATYKIPLLYYTYGSKFFLNQNYNAIPLEYGFELCKNSGFSKGQTYTIRIGINDEKAIPVNNEDFIYASCHLNGETIILKLSFDLPVKRFPYWDSEQKYMHLRPIIFMKDSEPINIGGTFHFFMPDSKGYTNCCHVTKEESHPH